MARRCRAAEWMDEPSSDPRKLARTLRQFRLINLFLGHPRSLLRNRFLRRMRQQPGRVYRLLDVGAGGCDLDRWLVRRCRREGLRLRITCLDHDPRVVAFARRACRGYPEIRVMEGSSRDLPRGPRYDFIFAYHFLHHLPDGEILPTLRLIEERSRLGYLLIDLHRSRLAWLGYSLLARVFLHRSFALEDGRLSICKSFHPRELEGYRARLAAPQRARVLRLAFWHLGLAGICG